MEENGVGFKKKLFFIFEPIVLFILLLNTIQSATYTYDLLQNTTNKAYNQTNPSQNIWNGVEFTGPMYYNVSYVDTNYALSCGNGSTSSNVEPKFRFNFTINETAEIITSLNVSFRGYDNASEIGVAYVWNRTSGALVSIGNLGSSAGWSQANYTGKNIANFIDPTNNQLVIYVEGPNFDGGDCLFADYARVIVYTETTSPQWFSNQTNSTISGEAVLHSINWTDNINLSGYIFSFDNGSGNFVNDSWVSFIGLSNWSNVTKITNTTLGSTIKWKVYANDTANNFKVTDTFEYTVFPHIYPQFSNYQDNNATINGSGTAFFNVTLENTNGTVLLEINGTNLTTENEAWINLNGQNQNINFGDSDSFSPAKTNNLSFLIWAKPFTQQTQALISKGGGADGKYEYELQLLSDGTVAMLVFQPTGDIHCNTLAVNAYTYSLNEWQLFYGEIINKTSCSISVNGKSKITSTTLTSSVAKSNSNLKLGERDSGTNDFNGSIGSFILFNNSLTSQQIKRYYNETEPLNPLGKSIIVLSYHQIRNLEGYDTIVNLTNFDNQMNYLNDTGYKSITYQEWKDWKNGLRDIPEKSVIIVFDDGSQTVYSNAYPIMNSYGFKGVVAVIPEIVNQDHGYDYGFMNWTEIGILNNNGWELAGHGVTDYLTIPTSELRIGNFSKVKSQIEGNTSAKVELFVYPFNQHNRTTDDDCSKIYKMCSGESYSFMDYDGFLFKKANLTHSNTSFLGLRRLIVLNTTTLSEFQILDYYANRVIDTPITASGGSIAKDNNGLFNGIITGATWTSTPYSFQRYFSSSGTYNYKWYSFGNGSENLINVSLTRAYVVNPGVSSCIYLGTGNWQINLGDYCLITTDYNLGINNITFTGIGNVTFNSSIIAKNIGGLPANQIGYFGKNAIIKIG